MPQPKILEKFTTHLTKTLANSFKIAIELDSPFVSPLTLLYSLTLQKGSVAAEILNKTKVAKEQLKSSLVEAREELDDNLFFMSAADFPALTKEARRALERAVTIAWQSDHSYVGTEHLLLALIELQEPELIRALDKQKIDERAVEQFANNVLSNMIKFPEITALLNHPGQTTAPAKTKTQSVPTKNRQPKKTPALDYFAVDLTNQKNANQKRDPLVGRAKEINRLMQILARRFKNNPVLLGDPGVGKTAIVEGLAQKIAAGEVPAELADKRILALDLGLVLAGTIYRGEFESRLKQILEEIKSDPRLIVFIDEVHTLVGTGGGGGTLDAANLLKPALARGEIRCIGATTAEEYKKHIESDAALERRFQPLLVAEPSAEETIDILTGLRANYEKYHDVKISDEAVATAVQLAGRYLPDKFFPDKAIDLMDEAAAAKKLSSQSTAVGQTIRLLENRLREIEEDKEQAVLNEKFDLALKLKDEEIELLQQLTEAETAPATSRLSTKNPPTVKGRDVAAVVAASSGLPLTQLDNEAKDRLLNLEKTINQSLVGQEAAVATIARALERAALGLNPTNRPLASFILAGPSGVGKTELAKILTQAIFNDPTALLRLDMSEFSEGFQASKMIGSPAGYVGYKDSNKFDALRRRPYAVVLFDEIDKAHPDVFNLLLQILDEGHLTDAAGKKINFKNTIILMTTNVGAEHFAPVPFGFESAKELTEKLNEDKITDARAGVIKDLQNKFRREFLNRLDALILFNPLSLEALQKIVDLRLTEVNERLAAQGLIIELSEAARIDLARKSAALDQGARAIAKVVREEVEEQLAGRLLSIKNGARKAKVRRELTKVLVESDGQNIVLENEK